MVAESQTFNNLNKIERPTYPTFVVVVNPKEHSTDRVYDLDEMEAYLYPLKSKELAAVVRDSVRLAYSAGKVAGAKHQA